MRKMDTIQTLLYSSQSLLISRDIGVDVQPAN
jgi:hypothetical protein